MANVGLGLLVSVVACLTWAVWVGQAFYLGCDLPSGQWCDSPDTATKCGVYEQCSKYVWHKNDLTVESESGGVVVTDAPPVKIGLYYELSCGSCEGFIEHMLYPTFLKIGEIMDIDMVPYGNTKEKKVGDHWEFTCQHGPNECVGNIIETCAIDIMKNISLYLPYIVCIESKWTVNATEAARECANESKFKIPVDEILECSTSARGNELEHQMALKTPVHHGVPYITCNGKHSFREQMVAMMNLTKLVCQTYTGTKPDACHGYY